MATELVAPGQERPFLTRWYEIDLTGTTEITVHPNLGVVKGALISWATKPDNTTYQCYCYIHSNKRDVVVGCSHASTDKVTLKVIGQN